MDSTSESDRSYVAKCGLFLFLFGLLAPFVLILLVMAFAGTRPPMTAAEDAAPFAAALGGIAEILALILGIIGRRHVAGRVAWIGVVVVLGVAFAAAMVWFLWSEGPVRSTGHPPIKPADPFPEPDRQSISPPIETSRPATKAPRAFPPEVEEKITRQQEATKPLGMTTAPAGDQPSSWTTLPSLGNGRAPIPLPTNPATRPVGAQR
jgi:hypothetical protein